MGFLDKLLGRTKDTASDLSDKAAPVVDKAEDLGGAAADKASDLVERTRHAGSDAGESPPGDTAPPSSGSAS